MAQSHKYEYDIAPNSAPDRVIRMVGSNKKVLELGSGPGAVTRKLTANDCKVTALEVDSSAIKIVRQYCENVYLCDFNNPDWVSTIPEIGKFDVLVAADVFEHLYDPWTCLKHLHQFLSASGSLVVSIPHVGHAAIMACLFNSDFDYHPWGLLDKTHIRFFGLSNVQKLFEYAGFKIIEVDFVITTPENSELAKQWSQLPKSAQSEFSSGKFSNIYQIVLRAVPVSSAGEPLKLLSLQIPEPGKVSVANRIQSYFRKSTLVSQLSPRTRERIKRVIGKFG